MSNRRKFKSKRRASPSQCRTNPTFLTSDFVTDDELLGILKAVMRNHPDGIEEDALFDAIGQVEEGIAVARLFLRTYEDNPRSREQLATAGIQIEDVRRLLHEFDHVLAGTMRVEFYDGGFEFAAR